jgi:Ni,Fe-hydrogenase maturation factor
MVSIHAMGLREAVRFLSRAEPPPIQVIGVEPLTFDYGLKLSAPVQAALPHVVQLARDTVFQWLQQDEPGRQPGVASVNPSSDLAFGKRL